MLNINSISLIDENTYEIPIGFVENMKVPGVFFATEAIYEMAKLEMQNWMENKNGGFPSLVQIANVSTLNGVLKYSIAMPDMHSGYGFSIGGVAAFDLSDPKAIISPGGIGYDINCGVRLLTTNLEYNFIKDKIEALTEALFESIPTGVGGKRQEFATKNDIDSILKDGAKWAVDRGYGIPSDLEFCEENGRVSYADPKYVSQRAKAKGFNQMGTLGSGNHYVEIQKVEDIYEEDIASMLGIKKDMIVVMIHTGSRGLGHQVATDYINEMMKIPEYKEGLIDEQLVAAPVSSPIGNKYLHAMGAAANFAWCNRQIITHFVRETFKKVLERDDLEMPLVYDVAHNIAKIEKHLVDGEIKETLVHRKGATRAFGIGREELPLKYRNFGQPVLIGGSLGTSSYILFGTDGAMKKSFGSTCHGAGRALSRSQVVKQTTKEEVEAEIQKIGVIVRAAGQKTIIEEAPHTYKDVDEVVRTCHTVGISRKIARLFPLGVIKG